MMCEKVGCVIDGSHMRADAFDVAVIEFAVARGFSWQGIDPGLSDEDRWEFLRWESDRAVDWLCDVLASSECVAFIDESCLFIEGV